MESKKATKTSQGLRNLLNGQSGVVTGKPVITPSDPDQTSPVKAGEQSHKRSMTQSIKSSGTLVTMSSEGTDVVTNGPNDVKNSAKTPTKATSAAVNKCSTEQEIPVSEVVPSLDEQEQPESRGEEPKSGTQESKASVEKERKTGRRKKKEKSPASLLVQESKNSRVIVENGHSRRPTNMTILDEYRIGLNILAAKRFVKPWKLLNEAIRRYLIEEGELDE